MKICLKCKVSKERSEYGPDRDRFGHSPDRCLACLKEISDARETKRAMRVSGKWICNRCGAEFVVTSSSRTYCKPCAASIRAEWRSSNLERARAIDRKSSKKYLTSTVEVHMRLKIIHRMRRALDTTLRRKHREKCGGTTQAMKDWIGCEPAMLKAYIEKQFTGGMCWDNYGKWHIDHVVPLCRFDANSEEDMKKAWHYSNLRPLWARDNLRRPHKYGRVSYQPQLMIGS